MKLHILLALVGILVAGSPAQATDACLLGDTNGNGAVSLGELP